VALRRKPAGGWDHDFEARGKAQIPERHHEKKTEVPELQNQTVEQNGNGMQRDYLGRPVLRAGTFEQVGGHSATLKTYSDEQIDGFHRPILSSFFGERHDLADPRGYENALPHAIVSGSKRSFEIGVDRGGVDRLGAQ